jgi:hypothetical protein
MSRTEELFQALLDGAPVSASPEAEALVKVVRALEPASRPGPAPQFRARLRSELLARAAAGPEEVFASMLDGTAIEAPEDLAPIRALALAVAATAPAPAVPAPAFRHALRRRLITEASRRRSPAARISDGLGALNDRMRRSLRAVAATGLAAMLVLGGGAAFASSHNALPGDAIRYDLKRFRERAQLWVISGPQEGRRLLEFAGTRLGEVRGLADRRDLREGLYVAALADMDEETTEGARILIDAFRAGGPRSLVEEVAQFATTQAQDLAVLIDRLPPGVRPVALDSLRLAELASQRASSILQGCPCPSNPLQAPTSVPSAPGASVGCACAAPASESYGDGSAPAAERRPVTATPTQPDPGSPARPPSEPGRFDSVPDVSGTPLDDEVKDTVDDILDQIEESPLPVPLPSPPSVLPLPIEPSVPALPIP